MNISDILITPSTTKPSFVYTPSSSYLPPKRIVIHHDRILRYNQDEKQYIDIHSIPQDEQRTDQGSTELDIYEIDQDQSTNNETDSNQIPKYQKRTYKTNRISKISIEERKRVKKRMANFDKKKSQAWKYLSLLYGTQIKQDKLISIAEYVASQLKIYIDRDARRRKCVLIKWFDENWNKIGPFFQVC